MKHALVFGGSGQIGRPLLGRLLRDGWRVTALSRQPQLERPGLTWLRGDLARCRRCRAQVDAIVSCGPLDAFAQWYAGIAAWTAPRVIAFGSTSVEVKRGSADPRERDVARRLREGEEGVFNAAAQRGGACAPAAPDAGLRRRPRCDADPHCARSRRRWGRFPLPRNASGLRQPVHVDDLAVAAFAAIGSVASHGQAYALPGGETLAYREMVRRVLAVLEPPPTLVELPSPLFNARAGGGASYGRGTGLGEAAVQRMRTDLVFDMARPRGATCGYAPRAFRPTARMFEPREETHEDGIAAICRATAFSLARQLGRAFAHRAQRDDQHAAQHHRAAEPQARPGPVAPERDAQHDREQRREQQVGRHLRDRMALHQQVVQAVADHRGDERRIQRAGPGHPARVGQFARARRLEQPARSPAAAARR